MKVELTGWGAEIGNLIQSCKEEKILVGFFAGALCVGAANWFMNKQASKERVQTVKLDKSTQKNLIDQIGTQNKRISELHEKLSDANKMIVDLQQQIIKLRTNP